MLLRRVLAAQFLILRNNVFGLTTAYIGERESRLALLLRRTMKYICFAKKAQIEELTIYSSIWGPLQTFKNRMFVSVSSDTFPEQLSTRLLFPELPLQGKTPLQCSVPDLESFDFTDFPTVYCLQIETTGGNLLQAL